MSGPAVHERQVMMMMMMMMMIMIMRDRGVDTYYPQGTVCYVDPSQGLYTMFVKFDQAEQLNNLYNFISEQKLFQLLALILGYQALV